MLTSSRRVLVVLSLVTFSFILVHITFRPLNGEKLQSFIRGRPYAEKLVGNLLDSTSPNLRVKPPNGLEPPSSSIGNAAEDSNRLEYDSASITSTSKAEGTSTIEVSQTRIPDRILVVAKQRSENTSWIDENFPDWPTAIYVVDDQNAEFHTSMNKGHEANVYLTYITEHYPNLPSIMVFLHSHQKHKHGTRDTFEGIDYDNLETLKALKLEHVQTTGYTNLRCRTNPGCPSEIQPFRPEQEMDPLRPQEREMAAAWRQLFLNDDVPQVIASPCCAQFAVTREQVLKRPKEEYERFLDWIHRTPLDDFTSGRIFEYLWQIIFGKDAVYCPDENQCYKDLYGTTAAAVHKHLVRRDRLRSRANVGL